MLKILVLAGGSSDEREVSLRSGDNVAGALQQAGYEVTHYDPATSSVGLSQAVQGHAAVFSVLHGAGGEDGTTQAPLERLGVPYVGSNVASSALCFDKWNYRALLASHGLPVAAGELVDKDTVWQSPLVEQPFVLKPPKGGSSIDTILAHNPAQLDKARVNATFDKHRQMLLEQLVTGTEITVGIFGSDPLPVIEIIPPEGADFDYTNKYNGTSQELCPPLHVSPEIQAKARALALEIHQRCDCRDYSRTDMIINPAGELVVLETNTLPGMTEQSLFPKMAATAGIPIAELCAKLVEMAMARQTA